LHSKYLAAEPDAEHRAQGHADRRAAPFGGAGVDGSGKPASKHESDDPLKKTEAKKRLSWDTQKALEVVPTIGGGTGHSVPLIPDADKFILMQF
jgi:hypothetical protein